MRIPKFARNFFLPHNVYTGSRIYSASYSVGTGVLYRGYSNQRVKLVTHLHLLRRLRISGAMPVLPVYAFRVLIWTILPLPQSLVLLFQWSATKRDPDALGDGFKKGFLSAMLVLSICIRANSRMSCDAARLTRRPIIIIIINCHYHQHENQ